MSLVHGHGDQGAAISEGPRIENRTDLSDKPLFLEGKDPVSDPFFIQVQTFGQNAKGAGHQGKGSLDAIK